MIYTCGVIFYRDGQILLGHTTGQMHWDLPKGKQEAGETFAEAAARECKEEIGFDVRINDLHYISEVPYVRGKRLVLFFSSSRKPAVSELFCDSTFTNSNGIERPEIDEFRYVDIDDIPLYCTKRMCKSIKEAVLNFFKDYNKERL